VPEPQGAGGRLQGVKPFPLETRFPVSPLAPQPAMPRMGRPPGPIPGLRESDQVSSGRTAHGQRLTTRSPGQSNISNISWHYCMPSSKMSWCRVPVATWVPHTM
jgi:hypothetical protein